jgi:hypothetical protein
MYCSTTSPFAPFSLVSPLVTTVTPEERGWIPITTARVVSVIPGSIGR